MIMCCLLFYYVIVGLYEYGADDDDDQRLPFLVFVHCFLVPLLRSSTYVYVYGLWNAMCLDSNKEK